MYRGILPQQGTELFPDATGIPVMVRVRNMENPTFAALALAHMKAPANRFLARCRHDRSLSTLRVVRRQVVIPEGRLEYSAVHGFEVLNVWVGDDLKNYIENERPMLIALKVIEHNSLQASGGWYGGTSPSLDSLISEEDLDVYENYWWTYTPGLHAADPIVRGKRHYYDSELFGHIARGYYVVHDMRAILTRAGDGDLNACFSFRPYSTGTSTVSNQSTHNRGVYYIEFVDGSLSPVYYLEMDQATRDLHYDTYAQLPSHELDDNNPAGYYVSNHKYTAAAAYNDRKALSDARGLGEPVHHYVMDSVTVGTITTTPTPMTLDLELWALPQIDGDPTEVESGTYWRANGVEVTGNYVGAGKIEENGVRIARLADVAVPFYSGRYGQIPVVQIRVPVRARYPYDERAHTTTLTASITCDTFLDTSYLTTVWYHENLSWHLWWDYGFHTLSMLKRLP